MDANDFISTVTDNLTGWGIPFDQSNEGLRVSTTTLTVDAQDETCTIMSDGELVAITSDTSKAATLLAFPIARRAWDDGYTGDFEVDVLDGSVSVCLNYGSDSVTIVADINSGRDFTVADHPLFRGFVDLTDITAALSSAELAYADRRDAWQVLCGATDFEGDGWEAIVKRFCWDACFEQGDRFTKVFSSESENVVLVEDYDPKSPTRVIDVQGVADSAYWSAGDVAAEVLWTISGTDQPGWS